MLEESRVAGELLFSWGDVFTLKAGPNTHRVEGKIKKISGP